MVFRDHRSPLSPLCPYEAPRGADGPTAAIVTIGDELLRADLEGSNADNASGMLGERGIPFRVCHAIAEAIPPTAGTDVIVVVGGLGPSSDDVTRNAVARALAYSAERREEARQDVEEGLTCFGIAVHDGNRCLPPFAEGADLLPNPTDRLRAAGPRLRAAVCSCSRARRASAFRCWRLCCTTETATSRASRGGHPRSPYPWHHRGGAGAGRRTRTG
ncbi:molybdopterin-binding protein [Streptomyces chattanoogensis]|uniref:molybdopterin-binding protein n=1 Tax=Streptomyces chattanoogensis TaxID=66876 RepID=UPI003CCBAFE3